MEYTRVNGIGLWNSWTRNFQTPLQALLDLLDNSFDASISKLDLKNANETKSSSSDDDGDDDKIQDCFEGKIHISALNYNDVFDASIDHLSNRVKKSGILIMNNSEKPIKPLSKILEVYHSTKGKRSDTMGENGVGLKQGCATLSDLSFIISRNKQTLEIGLIAASLQKEEGIYLPYFTIEVPSCDEKKDTNLSSLLKEKIMDAVKSKDGFHECIEEFGYGNIDFGSYQLISYCMSMLSNDWGDYSFCIILSDLRHKSNVESHDTYNNNTGIKIEAEENKFPSTPMTQESTNSLSEKHSQSISPRQERFSSEELGKAENLLKELKTELPKYYIHVPPHFDFQIEGSHVTFSHWQSRLVELWSFDVRIDPTNVWLNMNEAEWKCPTSGYDMKLYLGFDPVLAGSSSRNSACSLYFYARQSGRLIKSIQDARAILGLVNSGSDFSQGLTVIVDDYDGNLPLNPTKQDIAFGEEKHGNAHRTNLFAWISAYVHFFWKHHERKYRTEKKTKLSKNVLGFLDEVEKHTTATKNLPMRPLKDLQLTTFVEIPWMKHHTGRIRSRSNKLGMLRRGRGTKFRLTEELVFSDEELTPPKKSKRRRRKRKSPTRSLILSEEEMLRELTSTQNQSFSSPNGTHRRRRSTNVSYYQSNGFSDQEDIHDNYKYFTENANIDDESSEDFDDGEPYNNDRRKSYEYDDNETDNDEIKKKVHGLEEELKNALKEQENTTNNWKIQINEQENKISKLKKKIAGMERMMKAMIRSQSMI